MKNNRLKVLVNDGLGNITVKNFTNINDANKYHNSMHRKLYLKVTLRGEARPNLSELKIVRGHHEI